MECRNLQTIVGELSACSRAVKEEEVQALARSCV